MKSRNRRRSKRKRTRKEGIKKGKEKGRETGKERDNIVTRGKGITMNEEGKRKIVKNKEERGRGESYERWKVTIGKHEEKE